MTNKIDSFRAFFKTNTASKYFVAASGGLDSMVLIRLMIAENLPIHVLHVNYNLRGKESIEDAQFLTEFCSNTNIPITINNIHLKEKLNTEGGNLQNEARKARYQFFQEMQSSTKNSKVVIAHHLNDQIETFWLQLIRGSGMSGLAGMKAINGIYLRPMLDFTKSEIEEYAITNSIQWREDKSNSKNDYLRNRFRNEIIPFLQEKQDTLNDSILILQKVFRAEIKNDEEILENLKSKITTSLRIEIQDIQQLTASQCIELFKKLSIPIYIYKEIDKFINSQKGSKLVWNNGNSKLINEGNYFSIYRENEAENKEIPKLKISKIDSIPSKFNKTDLYFDMVKIEGEIQIRKWEIGDRIYPIGLRGSKLISDVITDAKIPNIQRKEQFVIIDNSKILACVGLCIDSRAIASEKTKEIICVSII